MLKNIFKSILFLYKNIFHWNISKILISISSYLLGIWLSIPFFIIFFILVYFSPFEFSNFFYGLDWTFNIIKEIQNGLFWVIIFIISFLTWILTLFLGIFEEIQNDLFWAIILITSFLAWILTLFLGIFYAKILLIKLNLNYLENKKLEFKKNKYFNLKLFIKASKIFLIIFSYLLILFLLFIIFFTITYFIFWSSELSIESFTNSNSFKIFSWIILFYVISFSLIWLYIIYRTYFAYYILAENKNYSALECIKKSIKITRKFKKLLKFSIINLILLLLYFPFSYIQQSIDKSSNMLNYYIELKNKKSVNIDFIIKWKINEESDYYILKNKYKDFSNTELMWKSRFLFFLQIFYFIFNFIFIYWILDLIYANFYKKTLNK